MLGGIPQTFRTLALGVALTLACAACEINVQLVTNVEADGSGRFSLRFVLDKELVELARTSGQDPFAALVCPEELTQLGWECGRSTEGGGLSISLDRAFKSADDFNGAMTQLERIAAEQQGPTAQFFKLKISRDSGFLQTRTSVEGSVDLTATGVLGNASAESRETLETIIEQAAGEFFTFRLQVDLPGTISKTTGDPERVDGGTATWTPRLGRSLSFGAESSAYNTGSLAAVGGPVVVLLILLVVVLIRRRSRNLPSAPDAEPAVGATAPPV